MQISDPPPGGYPEVVWYPPPKRPSLARRKRDFLRHPFRWGSMSKAVARTVHKSAFGQSRGEGNMSTKPK